MGERLGRLGEEAGQVERVGEHRHAAVRRAGPLFAGSVPIKFHPVFIGVAQIKRLAHAVVGRAIKRDLRATEAAQRIGQRRTRGVENGDVVKSGRARRRRFPAEAFPGVESDVMMITAGGNERGLRAEALHELEAEYTTVERERPIQVGNLEMHVADADPGINGRIS